MRQAVIYVRVSTLGQAESVSPEAQRARAEAWALANGYAVAGVFTDAGISGKRIGNRPALTAALDLVCSLAKQAKRVKDETPALVCYSLSRLARSTRDALAIGERLEKAGADFVSLSERIDTSGAAGKLFYAMLAAFAEFERDVIAERTKLALSHKRAKGERLGSIPFGFTVAADRVTLIPEAKEQATLTDLRTMREAGWTWKRIADELNARGMFNRSGDAWTLHNARKIFLAVAA